MVAVVAAGALVAASGVGLGLWASSGDDGGSSAAAPSSPSPTPSPTRSYPLSEAPRTIPAVREHTAERGPGWRPASGHRVVVSDPALADEGRLTARELGLAYAGERDDERPGDVRLELNRDAGANPESYTLTVRGGRVTVSGPAETGVFYGTRTLK
ncbi:MAG TPA: glycoside hydrolase family 20 zincin-like fold domain-containing protein, partial [Streptomyces sp.]|nr:glycoside hydrolase family 20 zincin-like fold domain-containing protein [Streptomyces sp.]